MTALNKNFNVFTTKLLYIVMMSAILTKTDDCFRCDQIQKTKPIAIGCLTKAGSVILARSHVYLNIVDICL